MTALLLFVTSCSDELDEGIPASLKMVQEFSRSTYSVVATVLVSDRAGKPVPGAEVRWSSFDPTAAVFPAVDTTDASGLSQAEWVVGSNRCADSLRATVAGLTPVYSHFTRSEPNAFRNVLNGNNQTGAPNSVLPDIIRIRLETSFGCGRLPGLKVNWVASNGGAPLPIDTLTTADGTVSTRWRLGPSAGPQRLDVFPGVPVDNFVPVAVSAIAQ